MNKRYDTLLFDLDGTLLDSKPGIELCFAYAMKRMNEAGPPVQLPEGFDFNTVIGPPLTHSFRQFTHSEEQVVQAITFYRELYFDTGWKMSDPFDGIRDALMLLKDSGKRLLVATSKLEDLARRTLEHHGIARYFDVIAGASKDDKRSSKQDVIVRALELAGVESTDCVMIGDRLHDMEGAQQTGMDAIGVLWGYGSRQELGGYQPILLAQTPAELCDYLLAQ